MNLGSDKTQLCIEIEKKWCFNSWAAIIQSNPRCHILNVCSVPLCANPSSKYIASFITRVVPHPPLCCLVLALCSAAPRQKSGPDLFSDPSVSVSLRSDQAPKLRKERKELQQLLCFQSKSLLYALYLLKKDSYFISLHNVALTFPPSRIFAMTSSHWNNPIWFIALVTCFPCVREKYKSMKDRNVLCHQSDVLSDNSCHLVCSEIVILLRVSFHNIVPSHMCSYLSRSLNSLAERELVLWALGQRHKNGGEQDAAKCREYAGCGI